MTKCGYLSHIRGWCDWLSRHHLVAMNPCASIRGPRRPRRVPRPGTRAQIKALYEQCETLDDRRIVSLMVQEGLRCVEVARLDWRDIDAESLVAAVRGKASHERYVPISTESQKLLNITEKPASGPVVTARRRDGRATPRAVSHRVSKLAQRAGLPLRAHDLRATAATDMLNAGAHIRDVQSILGHAHLTTTGKYVKPTWAHLEQAITGRRYTTT